MTRYISALLLCFGLTLTVWSAAGTAAPGSDQDDKPGHVNSLRELPGYVPLVDPESSAVVLGRRANAPLVRKPFKGGAKSLKELGQMICKVFEDTPKLDSLMQLTVTEDEFNDILWPEFPQSRPVTGLKAEDGWRVLYPRLLNGCNSALIDYAGGYWEFLRFDVDSVMKYRNFTLHHGVTMVVRDAAGAETRMNWLRSIAERKGRFKIYSTKD